jgi:hypothetical protein
MGFFELISQCKLALSREDEIELNYLFGKKFDYVFSKRSKEYEYEKKKTPRFTGVFFQSLIFFYKLLINIKFLEKKNSKKLIFVFLSSINQLNSINSTLEALKNNKNEFHLSVFKGLQEKNNKYECMMSVRFSLKIISVSTFLFFFRALPLFLKLKREGKKIEISWYFHKFCESYIYIPFFLDELQKIKPKIVVILNDHTVQTRSLRLSAEILGIKTIYIQHASVSETFPPLEFDYALLDGDAAYQIYKNCYQVNNNNKNVEKNIANCRIFFTGQKKSVFRKNSKKNFNGLQVGVATTKQDDFIFVKTILDRLLNMKLKCIVRTHPSQSLVFIKQLKEYMKVNDMLSWSNSQDQPIIEYFVNINLLIASNSGIHLEAALAGLPTFYHEMSEQVYKSDYYGFVKNNISEKLENNFSLDILESSIKKILVSKNRQLAIKNYSETFGSLWQNREGELTTLIINYILKNKSLTDLFKIQQSKIYHSVGYLKDI